MLRVVFFLPRDGWGWQVLDFYESRIVDVPFGCQFWLCTGMWHVAVCFLPRDCCSRRVHPVHHQASTKTTVNHHSPRKTTCRCFSQWPLESLCKHKRKHSKERAMAKYAGTGHFLFGKTHTVFSRRTLSIRLCPIRAARFAPPKRLGRGDGNN